MSSVQIDGQELFCKVVSYRVMIDEKYDKKRAAEMDACRDYYNKPYFFGLFKRPSLDDDGIEYWSKTIHGCDHPLYEIEWHRKLELSKVKGLEKLAYWACANNTMVTVTGEHAFILEYKGC